MEQGQRLDWMELMMMGVRYSGHGSHSSDKPGGDIVRMIGVGKLMNLRLIDGFAQQELLGRWRWSGI